MNNIALEKRENQPVSVPDRIDQGAYYTPLVDILETNDAFVFQADVPGVRPGDIDISFENGVLTIEGKVHSRQTHDQNYLWQEYGVGTFYRQFTLDAPAVNPDQIRAELRNGELRLTVPKAESAKTRKIQIKT